MAFVSRQKNVAEFLKTAQERFAWAMGQDAQDRRDAEEDVRFHHGDQWPLEVRKLREENDQPCITENRLPTFVAQVVNDGRRNKPALSASPLDGGDPKLVDYIESRFRQVEYESNADQAYDLSREQQIISGRGFYRVTTEYARRSVRRQVARIRRITNQFSVLWGPHEEYDCSDAPWCFVITRYTKEQFKEKFGGDAEAVRNNFWAHGANPAPEWIGIGAGGQEVMVAEYWLKESRKRVRAELASGEERWKDDLPADAVTIAEREEDDIAVWQYVIDGVQIHDESEWLGESIPVVPVWGREETVDGKVLHKSLIRYAKEPQQGLNLYASNIAMQIAQMPKSPYMVAVESIVDGESWEDIHISSRPYRLYKQYDSAGRLLNKPERIVQEPPIQALTIGLQQKVDAIKAAMGIYDASLGARGNETSGIAIQRRQTEADNANYHFGDNEARSRKRLGQILLEILPKLDKGMATVRLRSFEGKTKVAPRVEWDGAAYDAAVSTGPTYTSARQEEAATYSEIAKADPTFMAKAGDLFFRALDTPQAEKIAERYEAALPPELRPQKEGQEGAAPAIPPQVQAQVSALMQQHEQLVGQLNTLNEELRGRKLEIDSRERVEMAKLELEKQRLAAEIELGAAKLGSAEALVELRLEVENIRQELAGQRQAAAAQAQPEPEPQPAPVMEGATE